MVQRKKTAKEDSRQTNTNIKENKTSKTKERTWIDSWFR